MNHIPQQKNKYVVAIVVTLIAVGIVVYMTPAVLDVRALFFQCVSMICLIAAVFILIRYKTTSFIYTVRPRSLMHEDIDAETVLANGSLAIDRINPKYLDFVVSKKQGSRDANMECVLGLDSLRVAEEISPKAEHRKTADAVAAFRAKYGTVDLYDYTVTLGLENSLLLLFRDGPNYVAVRIEPDDAMREYLVGVAAQNCAAGEDD